MDYLTKLSGKKVAVVGLGYIGSRLLSLLKSFQDKIDLTVLGIDRGNLSVIATDEFDYLFNCAGNTGDFRQQPIETVESNIQLNLYLLNKCKVKESLVCLSSTRIYGFTEDDLKIFNEEDSIGQDHLSLDALYDNAKKLMECFVLNTPRDYKKVVVRLSNVFGNYELTDLDDSTFLKLMVRKKLQNENLMVRQNSNSTKDYIYIEDALEGILRSGILSAADDVYNICSGSSYSVQDWAEFLNSSIESVSDSPILYSRVSTRKAQEKLGFRVKQNLKNLRLADIVNSGT